MDTPRDKGNPKGQFESKNYWFVAREKIQQHEKLKKLEKPKKLKKLEKPRKLKKL